MSSSLHVCFPCIHELVDGIGQLKFVWQNASSLTQLLPEPGCNSTIPDETATRDSVGNGGEKALLTFIASVNRDQSEESMKNFSC